MLLVGQLPPPPNGMTLTTQALLSSEIVESLRVTHIDTSDHRAISNVGTLDLHNILLALKHGLKFAVALLRVRPDVIYLPVARNRLGFLRDVLFLVPARLSRKPVVVHLHSTSFAEYYGEESLVMRALIRLAFGPRTHAIVLAESLRDAFGPLVPLERTHVVPNGVPDVGGGPPAETRPPIVVHMTTMWTEKGVFDVLEIAARIRGLVPEARFLLAGPWYAERERATAVQEVARLGLKDTVSLLGPVAGEGKARLLHEASVFLFPSRYRFECQPLVILEALAAGTPVVATRIGVLEETIQDGVEGFLTPVGDQEALFTRTLTVLRDRALRGQIGTAARRRYERDFQLDKYADLLTGVLARIVTPESTEAAEVQRQETLAGARHD